MIEPCASRTARNDVFRRDQLDLVALAAKLVADGSEDFRIDLGKRGFEEGVACRLGCRCDGHVLKFLTVRRCAALNTVAGGSPRLPREICWPKCANRALPPPKPKKAASAGGLSGFKNGEIRARR